MKFYCLYVKQSTREQKTYKAHATFKYVISKFLTNPKTNQNT